MNKDTELLANLLLQLAAVTIYANAKEYDRAWDAFGDMQELIDEAGRADE